MAKKTSNLESQSSHPEIKGSITFVGDTKPSPFEKLSKSNAPIFAIGYKRLPGSSNYISYVYKIVDGVIESIEVGEPNLRAIVSDESKINFINKFENSDE